jgi:hypothetical protein
MNKVQNAVRWEAWIIEAVQVYAKKNKMDFTAAVNFFVENELNRYGYFRKDYEPTVDVRVEEPEREKGTGTRGR